MTAHRGHRARVDTDNRLVLERLTPLDVSNLRIERHGLPMNVAALAILEGGALLDGSGELALEAIRARIGNRLHLAPRLRQRLYQPGFGFGAPVWVDDASFDISRHVSTRPVPAGGEEALLATCVELNDRPFDQAHPLWEIWLLTGAPDGHVPMLIRFHHVLADGIAALLLLGTLFDAAPFDAAPGAPEPAGPPWTARPIPARSELLGDALRRSITGIRRGVHKIEHPRRTLAPARTLFRQAVQLAREGRAPRTSFNRPVGRQHRVLLVRADLEQAKQVAHAHHATVNDVVLCTIAGGARALLAGRGELQRPLVLKVSVAASVRAPTSASSGVGKVKVVVPCLGHHVTHRPRPDRAGDHRARPVGVEVQGAPESRAGMLDAEGFTLGPLPLAADAERGADQGEAANPVRAGRDICLSEQAVPGMAQYVPGRDARPGPDGFDIVQVGG